VQAGVGWAKRTVPIPTLSLMWGNVACVTKCLSHGLQATTEGCRPSEPEGTMESLKYSSCGQTTVPMGHCLAALSGCSSEGTEEDGPHFLPGGSRRRRRQRASTVSPGDSARDTVSVCGGLAAEAQ
jgi:hypothetical protein